MTLRYPHIEGSHQEQLSQIKSFLFQLVDELNNAIERLEEQKEAEEETT